VWGGSERGARLIRQWDWVLVALGLVFVGVGIGAMLAGY
jgi:hypothetical protein